MSPLSYSCYSTKQTSSVFNPCKKQSVFTSNMQCWPSGVFSGYSGLPPSPPPPPFQANTLFTSTLPPPPPPPFLLLRQRSIHLYFPKTKQKFLWTLFQKAGLVQEGTISVRQCRQHGGNRTLCPTHWHTMYHPMAHPMAHYVPPIGTPIGTLCTTHWQQVPAGFPPALWYGGLLVSKHKLTNYVHFMTNYLNIITNLVST